MGPEIVVPIAFFVMVAAISIGVPIVKAFSRRMDRQGSMPAVPPELVQRLERMEHAIDSIAVEVERISEGQRFTTKLLAERQRDSAAIPAGDTERR